MIALPHMTKQLCLEMYLHNSLEYCTCLHVYIIDSQLYIIRACENPLNMSMMNMRLAKPQTYRKFRVTNRIRFEHIQITVILLYQLLTSFTDDIVETHGYIRAGIPMGTCAGF